MVQALHKFTPSSPAGNGGVERRPQAQRRLFAGGLLTNVPQELKCDPLVERELWFPGRPRGKDEPRNSAFHRGCKPLPPSAGVTAYPPGLRLVLKGLKRGETAEPGSLKSGIPSRKHLWTAQAKVY